MTTEASQEKNSDFLIQISTRWLSAYIEAEFGWFRIAGVGMSWKNTDIHGLTFSERGFHVPQVIIGRWAFNYLDRGRI